MGVSGFQPETHTGPTPRVTPWRDGRTKAVRAEPGTPVCPWPAVPTLNEETVGPRDGPTVGRPLEEPGTGDDYGLWASARNPYCTACVSGYLL